MMNKDLWLFDYNQGIAYEAFSKSENADKSIDAYLSNHYNFRGKTILEIGAGSGKFTPILSKMSSKLYVVEKNANLMQINRNKNRGLENIDFILTDVKELTMAPGSVDIVFAGWSLTSMRESFNIVFDKLKKVLRKDGTILAIENAGDDEFCKIMDIEDFTFEMINIYLEMGFLFKKAIHTIIRLPHKNVFYNAFPGKKTVKLSSLEIPHKVLIMEMPASTLYNQKPNKPKFYSKKKKINENH